MTTQTRAFRPLAATQNIAVTSASQSYTLNFNLGVRTLRVCNVGTDTIFIYIRSDAVGTAAAVATAMPILANTCDWFTIPLEVTTIQVIGATGGLSTMYTTVGEGM